MMKEENILKKKFGRENHFTVPDGYFNNFADTLMERLPESDTRVISMRAELWWHRLPMRKIAACLGTVVVLSAGGVFYANHTHKKQISMSKAAQVNIAGNNQESDMFDQMVDYTMFDNQDIYASLASESQNGL